MKSLIVTLVLLVLMLGCVVGNYFYINRVADEMEALLNALPDIGEEDCAAGTAELRSYWEKRVGFVGLSVGYTVVDRVSEQAATLEACASCGDLFGFRTAAALLRDALGDVRRLERFSLENLM